MGRLEGMEATQAGVGNWPYALRSRRMPGVTKPEGIRQWSGSSAGQEFRGFAALEFGLYSLLWGEVYAGIYAEDQ